MTEPILALREIHTHIGRHHILQGVSLAVQAGRATVLVGRNGAGQVHHPAEPSWACPRPRRAPSNWTARRSRSGTPYEIARLGIGFVPEDQRRPLHPDRGGELPAGHVPARAQGAWEPAGNDF